MKNKMVKRFLAGALSALLAVGMLAGCGGNADDKKGTGKQGSEGESKGGIGEPAGDVRVGHPDGGHGVRGEIYAELSGISGRKPGTETLGDGEVG